MKKIDKLQQLLSKLPNREKYIDSLPSYEFIQTIIQGVNEHRFAFAENEIKKSEMVYLLLSDDLESDEREWYESILQELRTALLSAR